ncbi:MAG: hypothetical protein WBA45_01895 [Microthrixaceae bacterium]
MTDGAEPSGAPDPTEGEWPSWRRHVWADLLPDALAPPQSGLRAPEYERPDWLDSSRAHTELSLGLAKDLFELAEARADHGEARGGKIAQSALTLLAIAFTATGFLAARLRVLDVDVWVWITLLPAAIAIVSLSLAALQAMDAEQRVRLSFPPLIDDVAQAEPADQTAKLVEGYDQAAFLANWCSNRRLDELIQAKAWLTRGIIALIVTGLIVVGAWSVATPNQESTPRSHHPHDHGDDRPDDRQDPRGG